MTRRHPPIEPTFRVAAVDDMTCTVFNLGTR